MSQKIVLNKALGTGVPGEFYSNAPQRSRGKVINSASEALNLIGTVVTQDATESDQVGVASSSVFAGIIGSPKSLYRNGLDPQTVIPNGTAVECYLQGYVVVTLPAAATIGDYVYYSDTTGLLATAAPGASTPAGHSRVPGGLVKIQNVASAGIGIIYLDDGGDITEPV